MLFVSIIYIYMCSRKTDPVSSNRTPRVLPSVSLWRPDEFTRRGKISTVSMYTDTKADGKTKAAGKGNTDNQLCHAWDLPPSPFPPPPPTDPVTDGTFLVPTLSCVGSPSLPPPPSLRLLPLTLWQMELFWSQLCHVWDPPPSPLPSASSHWPCDRWNFFGPNSVMCGISLPPPPPPSLRLLPLTLWQMELFWSQLCHVWDLPPSPIPSASSHWPCDRWNFFGPNSVMYGISFPPPFPPPPPTDPVTDGTFLVPTLSCVGSPSLPPPSLRLLPLTLWQMELFWSQLCHVWDLPPSPLPSASSHWPCDRWNFFGPNSVMYGISLPPPFPPPPPTDPVTDGTFLVPTLPCMGFPSLPLSLHLLPLTLW